MYDTVVWVGLTNCASVGTHWIDVGARLLLRYLKYGTSRMVPLLKDHSIQLRRRTCVPVLSCFVTSTVSHMSISGLGFGVKHSRI